MVCAAWLAQGAKETQLMHTKPEEYPKSVFLHPYSEQLAPSQGLFSRACAPVASQGQAHHCCDHSAVVADSFHCGLQILSTSPLGMHHLFSARLWMDQRRPFQASRSKAMSNATLIGW